MDYYAVKHITLAIKAALRTGCFAACKGVEFRGNRVAFVSTDAYDCHCHYLRWRMPPFMRQCWGLQVGPMHKTAGMGKLINAALLSLMRRVWVYALLPSSWVNSSALLAYRRDRVTREVGCGPSGKGSGEEGILSGVVPVYLYCPAFNVSVSLGV